MTANCETIALRFLAQRDHARKELARKLRRHECCDTESVEMVLDRFQAMGYLDDERFAEAFVRSAIARSQGPVKILYELRERGVCESTANQALAQAEVDWEGLATTLRERKFGAELPTDFKERARQSRFLAGRGFYTDTIKAVFYE